MDAKTDIILVTYNRLDFTKACLFSILENTKLPFRLIVIDNASNDGTREFLVAQKARGNIDSLTLNTKNKGLEKALNQGLRKVKSSHFVTIDNDIIVSEYWLVRLRNLMKDNPVFGAIACRPQILIGVGNIFKGSNEIAEANVVGGSARLLNTELVRDAKGWGGKEGRGAEEWDICTKIKERHYRVGYAREVWCYHQFGENGNWGYDTVEDYRMGRVLESSPSDIEYDPKTCEPSIRYNE